MEDIQPTVTQNDAKPTIGRRPLVLGLLAALLFLTAGIYYEHNTGDARADSLTPGQVIVTAKGFSPATIRIKKGQQVIWQNNDYQPHQVISTANPTLNESQSTIMAHADTSAVTFEHTGTFQYHDDLSTPGFQGTIIVE